MKFFAEIFGYFNYFLYFCTRVLTKNAPIRK